MARRIQAHMPATGAYAEKLEREGIVTAEEVAGWQEAQKKRLYDIYDQPSSKRKSTNCWR